MLPSECVKKGAEYLDKTYPNWWNRIDIEKFDINKQNCCPIGQLNEGFFKSSEYKRETSQWLAEHAFGFVLDYQANNFNNWWIEEIRKRRWPVSENVVINDCEKRSVTTFNDIEVLQGFKMGGIKYIKLTTDLIYTVATKYVVSAPLSTVEVVPLKTEINIS